MNNKKKRTQSVVPLLQALIKKYDATTRPSNALVISIAICALIEAQLQKKETNNG